MSLPVTTSDRAAPAAPPGFWQRRVVRPIIGQFTLGITPDRIAATLAVGTACSVFPFFGFTTLLNVGAGLALKLNHPILHVINQLLGPVQLMLILVYVRIGETVWHAAGERITIHEIVTTFREASLEAFLQRFGWAGVHALTAWVITTPLLVAAIYLTLRPLLRRLQKGSAA